MEKMKPTLKIIFIVYIINLTFLVFIFLAFKLLNLDIKNLLINSKQENTKFFNNQKNILWANKISDGGYLLYFRHSERKKLPNLKAFDGLEYLKKYKAEETYFADRSCLNQNGKSEAKLIGEYFKFYNINYSEVISSPSCRARQTAILAFNQIDKISNLFMYISPFVQNIEKDNAIKNLKKNKIIEYLKKLKFEKNKNVIVVGHRGVILPSMIDNDFSKSDLQTLESGFLILKITDNEINFKYKFNSFEDFTIALNHFKFE